MIPRLKRWTVLGLSTLCALSSTAAAMPYQHVRVSNMSELVKALGSHRTIHLEPGIYRAAAEQPTLILKNLSNVRLVGEDPQNTILANDRCHTPLIDFQNSSRVRVENLGFARLQRDADEQLDCSPEPRQELRGRNRPLIKPVSKILRWQELATDIVQRRQQGIELPEYTAPIYENLREQVQQDTRALRATEDHWPQRTYSMRPRLGQDYSFKHGKFWHESGVLAQAATMVFDRSENLLVALDDRAEVIFAVEARNNTRRSWTHSESWLQENAIVPQSNAPAPNGIYAMGRALKDRPESGVDFGSYRILIAGGMPTLREILFHSRDKRQQQEIPWNVDQNQSNSRTLGCILMQDPDLVLLANTLQQTQKPIALVIQGRYAKNLRSPEIL